MSATNLIPLIPLMVAFMAFFFLSDTTAIVRGKLVGRTLIRITDNYGESWVSRVEIVRPGKLRAWRYSTIKIGSVSLDEETNTGSYCGSRLTWKFI